MLHSIHRLPLIIELSPDTVILLFEHFRSFHTSLYTYALQLVEAELAAGSIHQVMNRHEIEERDAAGNLLATYIYSTATATPSTSTSTSPRKGKESEDVRRIDVLVSSMTYHAPKACIMD